MAYHRHCRNPRCGDQISPTAILPLCWSCRLMIRTGLAVGTCLGAAIATLWQRLQVTP